MTGTSLNNDRFPTDQHLLLATSVCAALALTLPTDRVQSFAELLAIVITVLAARR